MMVSPGLGFSELLIVLLSGGIGLPLSIPPAAEDPLLAQIAPEDCIYYTCWAGTTEADPDSPNQTERLVAEPEIQKFIRDVESQLQKTLEAQGPDQGAAIFLQKTPLWGQLLLTRPTAFFVSDLQVHDDLDDESNLTIGELSLTIHGAMVVNLGAAQEKFQQSLQAVQDQLNDAREIRIGDARFTQWAPDPDGLQWTWGFKDHYLIVATDKASAAGVIDRMETPIPQWLIRTRERFPVARRATLTHTDLEKLTTLALDREQFDWVETAGIDELRSLVTVTGLDESGYVSRTLIEFCPDADGPLAKLASQPLSPNDLARIPTDSTVAVAARMNIGELLDAFMQIAGKINPQFPNDFAQFEQGFAQNLGFRINDVLRSLGGTWTLHASPEDGGILTGWTLTVSVEKPERIAECHQRFVGFLRNFNDPNSPRVKTTKVGDKEYHTLVVPDDDFIAAPSWYFDEERFVFCLFPQPLRAALNPESFETGLSKAPKCAHLFDTDAPPSLVVYIDTATLLRFAYPMLQVMVRSMLGEMQSQGLAFDISMLPSLRSINKHLDPTLFSIRRKQEGLVIESHSTVPGGSLGAAAPVLAGLSIPAISSAQAAARRAEATANLRQLMLALLNHEAAQQCFPPAYTADAEGKPLLSWRVHILPYLGSGSLYNEFKLDEPWDSPHNRKLIARMPEVFKAPGAEADPGKTNYLAIGGAKCVFDKPEKDNQGSRMRDLRDGTSNTIGLVEASNDLAVIWTKPDLFVPQKDNPMLGLAGLRDGVILVGFCDGSVRTIPVRIEPDALWAMFTMDGGETVNTSRF